MNHLDKGANVVCGALLLVLGFCLWFSCAMQVIRTTRLKEPPPPNPLATLVVFVAPFFAGFCWLVGWLFA